MTTATWAVGLGITLVGIALVCLSAYRLYLGDRERKRHRQAEQPICGCGHHLSFHKDDGPCKWTRLTDYNREKHECGCQRYYGPAGTEWMP